MAEEEKFTGTEWDNFVKEQAEKWVNSYSNWLEKYPTENILVLHYEKMRENLE